jgi:HEAT repeat protein
MTVRLCMSARVFVVKCAILLLVGGFNIATVSAQPPFAPLRPSQPLRPSLPPAAPGELRALFTGTEEEREAFLEKILSSGKLPGELLARMLESGTPLMRLRSLTAIDSQSPASPAAIGKLRSRLAHANSPIEKIFTARAIVQSSGDQSQTVEDEAFVVLEKAFHSSDETQANEAAQSLLAIGAPATPLLVKALESQDVAVRRLAVDCLRQLGMEAATAKPVLLSMVDNDSNPQVRSLAAHAVIKVTDNPSSTAQSLIKSLTIAAPETAVAITDALANLGAPAVDPLIQSLSDPRSRYWSVLALSEIGKEAAKAEEPLADLLDVTSADVAVEVLIALPKIGASRPETVAKVAKLLAKGNVDLRFPATFAIARMGIKNDVAESAMSQNMSGDDLFLKAISTWAIAKTNPRDPSKGIATIRSLGELEAANDPKVKEFVQLVLSDLRSTIGKHAD